MKVLYFDVETTGTDSVSNDIIQIAGLVEIHGNVVETFDIKMQPFNYDDISPEALEVNNTTLKTLRSYQSPQEAYVKFINMLIKYVDPYNKKDKFYPAGYNVVFDIDFLRNFFLKNDNKYYGSWLNNRKVDPLYLLPILEHRERIPVLENHKLSTVCEHFGIEINAHDALSDIKATREVLIDLLLLLVGDRKDDGSKGKG